jgi:hypothetical protein
MNMTCCSHEDSRVWDRRIALGQLQRAVELCIFIRIYQNRKSTAVEPDRNPDVLKVVETIRQRASRSEQSAQPAGGDVPQGATQALVEDPTSISHLRFAALSSRLAQVAARASADAIAAPARAHDPMPSDTVLRLLTDIRRMAEAIAAISAGDAVSIGRDTP